MKIAVCVKEVVADRQAQLMFQKSRLDIDPTYSTFETNEADLYALEEALRLVEAAGAGEVIAITVGDIRADKMLQKCVAMGANRPIRVWADGLSVNDAIGVASALARVIREEQADLVLCGVQSSDAAQQSTGPALAALLGLPCVTAAARLVVDGGTATVSSEREGGQIEVVQVDLPAVVTVQTGLNTPRSGSFKQLMLAKKTPIAVTDPGAVRLGARVVRMFEAPATAERAELLPGAPDSIARRIIDLVRGDAA